ncbi:MAG: hypothetical protein EZS28_025050 [Streblomastix strix]|uniref:Uncharacterized protein n=1 Tax=Streblomastix strix TaxID=222440 RepID=A0A5J4VA99_9EUKA|nr:MAG: hypothetical protein EZS28_025050 [Streblomastix strix]
MEVIQIFQHQKRIFLEQFKHFIAKLVAHALIITQAYDPQHCTLEIPHVFFHGILYDEFESTLARKIDEHEAVGN